MSAELKGRLTPNGVLIGQLNTTGGSGTDNYNDLVNKPSINGVTLAGNKTSTDLGINIPTKVSQLQNDSHYVQQSAIPTKTSQLQNDSGFAYAANLATVATTGSYNNLTDKPTIPTKTSQLQNDSNFVTSSSLATVATSGSYDDLTNKPTIPAAQVNSDWNSSSGVSEILNKPTLAAVATSGSYNDLTDTPNLAAVATSGSYDDLTNKPTIPAAQVNADWNSSSGVSEILNKPTIPVNSDFSLSGLSDTAISSPATNQQLKYNGTKWVNETVNTSCTITKGSTMPTNFPIAKLDRYEGIMIFSFDSQIPAGNYATSDVLWNVSPAPKRATRSLLMLGSNVIVMTIYNSGQVRFNSSQNLATDTYLIGEIVYYTDG